MKLQPCKILLIACSILMSNLGFSQSNKIEIEFIGNCGLRMTDGSTNIYVDFPYKSGAHGYMEFDKTELDSISTNSIFIFTHKHSDHYSKKNLRRVLKAKGGQTYGPWNVAELENLGSSIPDFEIKAFRTTHKVFGISFKHFSYSIQWHGKNIYLSGDTESAETIANMKDIDWAFIPYWLLIDARENKIEIDAEMLFIYHLATPQIPSAKRNWDLIEHIHPLTEQGEIISLSY